MSREIKDLQEEKNDLAAGWIAAVKTIAVQQARIAELEALYDKAFSGSGGLLHRKELVRMLDERDAQLAELRDAATEVHRISERDHDAWHKLAALLQEVSDG